MNSELDGSASHFLTAAISASRDAVKTDGVRGYSARPRTAFQYDCKSCTPGETRSANLVNHTSTAGAISSQCSKSFASRATTSRHSDFERLSSAHLSFFCHTRGVTNTYAKRL